MVRKVITINIYTKDRVIDSFGGLVHEESRDTHSTRGPCHLDDLCRRIPPETPPGSCTF